MARASGAHDDIRRQMGSDPDASHADEPDDFDRDLGGWKDRYTEEAERNEAVRRERDLHRSNVRQAAQRRATSSTGPTSSSGGGSRRGGIRRTAAARRSSPSPGRRRRRGKPSFSDPTGGRLPITFDGDGLGGLFIGAVVYALVLSVVDYGASGPGMWFKAKFLNQVGSSSSTGAAAGPITPVPTHGGILG